MLFSCCIKADKQDNQIQTPAKQTSRSKPLSEIVVTHTSSMSSRLHEPPKQKRLVESKDEMNSYASKKQVKKQQCLAKTSTVSMNHQRESVEQLGYTGGLNPIWLKQQKRKLLLCNTASNSEMLLFYKVDSVDQQSEFEIGEFEKKRQFQPKMEFNDFVLIVAERITLKLIEYLNQNYQANQVLLGVTNQYEYQMTKIDHRYQVFFMKQKCVGFERIRSVYVYLQQHLSMKYMQAFIVNIFCNYSLSNLLCLRFMLPLWINLNQISILLTKLVKKSVRTIKCSALSAFLSYNIKVQCQGSRSHLLLYSGYNSRSDHEQSREIFQNKIILAMNLLGIALDHGNLEIYYKLIDGIISDLTSIEYIEVFKALHQDKKNFIFKLRDLKIYTQEELHIIRDIQKNHKIQCLRQCDYFISLNNACIDKTHQIFKDFHSSPDLKQSFRKIMEWDDGLTYEFLQQSQNFKQSKPMCSAISDESPLRQIIMGDSLDQADALNQNGDT